LVEAVSPPARKVVDGLGEHPAVARAPFRVALKEVGDDLVGVVLVGKDLPEGLDGGVDEVAVDFHGGA
jgi:hypothetical protein